MRTSLLLGTFAALAVGCGNSSSGGGGDTGTGGTGGSSAALSFFVSSTGSGEDGGNFGGLEGADARCQSLADAVGAGSLTWHAYLSSSEEDARDRIGGGPWYNANSVLVANTVEELHETGLEPRLPIDDTSTNTIALDENGAIVPLMDHDIVTGSEEDGTVFEGRTCQDYTSNSADDVAQVGHSDIPPPPLFPSWNSAHDTLSCTVQGLAERFGNGRVYCFAL